MATTPEGAVKKQVRALLKDMERHLGPIYTFMPVQGGYGAATLDFICCSKGRFFAIETKAPGKHLTERQVAIMREMERADARVFVISDDNGLTELRAWLTGLIE